MEEYIYIVYGEPGYCELGCCEVIVKIFLRKYRAEAYLATLPQFEALEYAMNYRIQRVKLG